MSWRHFCRTSWKCLSKTSWICFNKTSWRCFEDFLKTSWRRLEYVLKTFLQNILKTSWSCFANVLKRCWKPLEDVLKMSWRRFCKTSWRNMSKGNIFILIKTSWRLLHQDGCLLGKFSMRKLSVYGQLRRVCYMLLKLETLLVVLSCSKNKIGNSF